MCIFILLITLHYFFTASKHCSIILLSLIPIAVTLLAPLNILLSLLFETKTTGAFFASGDATKA
ncbi:hypothetical protein QG3_0809 [Clostridioides difficile CD169]|nr:hypothetical protein QG3_0809 [Clostridioides difficile CD169]